MGSGSWEQARKSEHYYLKKNTDTLKIPLFWTKTSPCNWEMRYVSTDVNGQCMHMHRVALKSRTPENASADEWLAMPASVAYTCKLDSAGECFECTSTNGEKSMDFILDEKSPINHLNIDLKGF